MEIKVITLGEEIKEMDYKPATIDAWYDRHTRDWCIQILNKEGYEVQNCIRVGDKKTKDSVVKDLKKEFGI